MVDTSDFAISYCPTNIYSVGTPHEIITATVQHKPVLFVSPPINFPTLHELRKHLRNDPKGAALLARLEGEIPIKENPRAIPSLWYIPLVGGENFFDGFGFASYRKKMAWKDDIAIDEHERRHKPKRPLLPFLEKLARKLPQKVGPASYTNSYPMTIGCSGIFRMARSAANISRGFGNSMTSLELELREALQRFMATTSKRQPEQIAEALNQILHLEQQLSPEAPPMLRHYLERRSYQKALDFLNSGQAETETPQCGH